MSADGTTQDTAGLDDHALARHLADEAGTYLLGLRARGVDLEAGELRRQGDAGAQDVLMRSLAASRPDDAVLSEEARDSPARLDAARVWIIDPLDGTREYGEHDRWDWAVHVALWESGQLVAGAVARPGMGSTLATDQPPVSPRGRPSVIRLAVSRSRPPAFVEVLAQKLGGELVPMGSAGIKATAVLDDVVDAYVHAGGQYEWDSAAPVAVAQAAGLHVSRINGAPLRYNQQDPMLPDLVICRPEVAEDLLAAIADLV